VLSSTSNNQGLLRLACSYLTVEHCEKELAQFTLIVNECELVCQQKGIGEAASLKNFKAKILTLAGRVACIEAIWEIGMHTMVGS